MGRRVESAGLSWQLTLPSVKELGLQDRVTGAGTGSALRHEERGFVSTPAPPCSAVLATLCSLVLGTRGRCQDVILLVAAPVACIFHGRFPSDSWEFQYHGRDYLVINCQ